MDQVDLTKKAIELLNKNKPIEIYQYNISRFDGPSLSGIKVEIRTKKLKYGILTFVIDDPVYNPGWGWDEDANCGADRAKTLEGKIIVRLAYIIWKNFLFYR